MEIDFDSFTLQHIEATLLTNCFNTGDMKKNQAMTDYFSLKNHPQASFIMTKCRKFSKLTNNSYQLIISGALQFASIHRQLAINCMIKRNATDMLFCNLQFKWSFKAYGLKAPRLLFLTVRDIVDINAHLEFIAQ